MSECLCSVFAGRMSSEIAKGTRALHKFSFDKKSLTKMDPEHKRVSLSLEYFTCKCCLHETPAVLELCTVKAVFH